ncbi:unnamed protein product [Ranitomeya imitator]|uniref:ribonuclease H n=1 Tax=Ranitomeya imitator TaxID=111125 RepID=A0ABN9LLA9_9NEOB|nr:unnamed protein product [Ranitomeya imitator]
MESLRSVIASMEQGEFLASIDIRDAYLHIPIFPPHQRFLHFSVRREHFQFTALPFGLAAAPRVFTKVMAAVMSILHSRGLVVLPYLDDLLIKGPSFQGCKECVRISLDPLSRLGWWINLRKSSPVPAQLIYFLGIILDTSRGMVLLPQDKVIALQQGVRALCHPSPRSIRFSMRVLGENGRCNGSGLIRSVASMSPTTCNFGRMGQEPLLSRSPVMTFPAGQTDTQVVDVSVLPPSREIFPPGRPIQIQSDNATAVAYINRGGTLSKVAMREVKRIVRWDERNHLVISAVHIPGVENWAVNFLSRQGLASGEWSFHPEIFQQICLSWGTPSRFNAKVPEFVARSREPSGSTENAFPGSYLPPELRGPVFDGLAIESWVQTQDGFSQEVVSNMINARKPVSACIYHRIWKTSGFLHSHHSGISSVRPRFRPGTGLPQGTVLALSVLFQHKITSKPQESPFESLQNGSLSPIMEGCLPSRVNFNQKSFRIVVSTLPSSLSDLSSGLVAYTHGPVSPNEWLIEKDFTEKQSKNDGKRSKDALSPIKSESEPKKSEESSSDRSPDPVSRRGRKSKRSLSSSETECSEPEKKRKKSESIEEDEDEDGEEGDDSEDEEDGHRGATTRLASRLEAQRYKEIKMKFPD